MRSFNFPIFAVALAVLTCVASGGHAHADDGFPFGMEMTLDAARQP